MREDFIGAAIFAAQKALIYWWARQDSNLQPDRYERIALTRNAMKISAFRHASMRRVAVWFTRFIGEPLGRFGFAPIFAVASLM